MKEINFKYLAISWYYDKYEPNRFRIFKHEGAPFFKRFSKVIEWTLCGKSVFIEF